MWIVRQARNAVPHTVHTVRTTVPAPQDAWERVCVCAWPVRVRLGGMCPERVRSHCIGRGKVDLPVDTLVRFDTETEEFQTWLIPSGGGVIRNMMATADGNRVLACSAVNRVALVECSRN